ncbi:MAG TPA: hypothetical protein VNJ09_02300 [Chthonomonadales bacterium]|nr:hypothetical protein [Chthonomonadales bacterium]
MATKVPIQDPETRIQAIMERCRNMRPARLGFLSVWSLLPPRQRDRIRLGVLCACCATLFAILLMRPAPQTDPFDTIVAGANLPMRPYVSAPPQIPINDILVHHDPWEFMNTPSDRRSLAPVSSVDIVTASR